MYLPIYLPFSPTSTLEKIIPQAKLITVEMKSYSISRKIFFQSTVLDLNFCCRHPVQGTYLSTYLFSHLYPRKNNFTGKADNCRNEKLRNIKKNIFSKHRPWPQFLLLSMRQDVWGNFWRSLHILSLGKHVQPTTAFIYPYPKNTSIGSLAAPPPYRSGEKFRRLPKPLTIPTLQNSSAGYLKKKPTLTHPSPILTLEKWRAWY